MSLVKELLVFTALDVFLNLKIDIVQKVLENSQKSLNLVLVIRDFLNSLVGTNKLQS